MKKLFIVVAAMTGLSVLTACHGGRNERLAEDEFVVEGTLPADRYEGAWLYMPKPVDSVQVARDGFFRFTGNVEQVAVLRLDWHVRYGIQELLVVTEPGVTRVRLDSISSCVEGTPQNMLLQQWKEHQQNFFATRARIIKMKQEGVSEDIWKAMQDTCAINQGDFVYNVLKSNGANTATRFIGTMLNGRIDSIRRAELKELLVDTTDYTRPQPGFRR